MTVTVLALPNTQIVAISSPTETVFVERGDIPVLIGDILKAAAHLAATDSALATPTPLREAMAETHSVHADVLAFRCNPDESLGAA